MADEFAAVRQADGTLDLCWRQDRGPGDHPAYRRVGWPVCDCKGVAGDHGYCDQSCYPLRSVDFIGKPHALPPGASVVLRHPIEAVWDARQKRRETFAWYCVDVALALTITLTVLYVLNELAR